MMLLMQVQGMILLMAEMMMIFFMGTTIMMH